MSDKPVPDPEAYARALSDEQLLAYKTEFGEHSREWIIAQRELSRRREPPGYRKGYAIFMILCLGWLAYYLFR
jgi:hypothetical protein